LAIQWSNPASKLSSGTGCLACSPKDANNEVKLEGGWQNNRGAAAHEKIRFVAIGGERIQQHNAGGGVESLQWLNGGDMNGTWSLEMASGAKPSKYCALGSKFG
jgi:hypothetical protein